MAIQPSAQLLQAIRAYKNGNREVFTDIYNLSAPYLTKCALSVLNRTAPEGTQDLLQDVLQETYLTIAEKLHTLQKEESYFQWAGQIVTNHALRTWTQDARQKAMEQPEDDLVYELPDERFIPEDILENKEKQQLIRDMLQQLPNSQYFCLVEYFYNGLTEKEVAEKLGMPLGTVKTNLSRAKKKLKEIVQTHEKKKGVKLYSMSWMLLLLFWQDIKAAFVSTGTVAGAAAVLAEEAVAGAAASATGTVAGAAASGVAAKIAAGVMAVALAVGGTVAIVSNQESPAPPANQETVWQDPAETPTEAPTEAPVVKVSQDIPLSAQTLAYMNRIAGSITLPAPATGPALSYQKGVESYSVNSVVAGCAGTKGLLQGQASANGLTVSKADLDQFMLDVLGWQAPIAAYAYPDITPVGSDSYLIRQYSGDREIPISIHDIRIATTGTVEIIVPKGYTSYACFFEKASNSPYGWILTGAVDTQQRVDETDVMHTKLFENGIVLPAAGESTLTAISDFGELTMDAAAAYIRYYWEQTTGEAPHRVTVEDWGLIGNGYYTYKAYCKDVNGETLGCFLIGTLDAYIGIHNDQTYETTWLTWTLTE